MGAFYGHMNHLYDNGTLKFGTLKNILKSASQGELEGTEKLDGMNLYVSYSIKDGQAKAVRNAGNIKSGGLNAEELAKKFAGRQGVEEAFNTAFQGFERAVRALTPKQQQKIFGNDADIFYNSEVIDERAINVINYNTRSLIIHRVGHVFFDKRDGEVKDVNISENFETLNRALARMNTVFAEDEFSVQVNAVRKLEKFLDDSIADSAIENISEIQRQYTLNDNNQVNDLLAARIVPAVKNLPISNDSKRELIIKILNLKGAESITTIKKGLTPEQKSKVQEVWSNRKNLFKEAVLPLEEVIHDFAIAALEAFHSQYVLDRNEPENIRRRIKMAIQTIKNSNDENQMSVMTKQLNKIKDIEYSNIGTTEGFVFVGPDGYTYKLTGNFAPINQILGMSRRNSPVQKLKEQDGSSPKYIEIKRTVGIYPGKFKPPHNGHLFSIKEALKKCTDVLVLVAPVERTLQDGTSITWQKSIDLLNLFVEAEGIDANRVTITKSSTNSPVRATYEVLEGANEDLLQMGFPTEGDLIIPIRSDKEDPRSKKPDWHIFKDFHMEDSPVPNVYAADVTEFVIPSYKGLGATEFRAALENDEDIKKFIPSSVDSNTVLEILEIKKKETEPNPENMDSESLSDDQTTGAEEQMQENFQSDTAKPRTSKGHKKLLDLGRKDLIKHGAPFSVARPVDKSNAFLAKEEHEEGHKEKSETKYVVVDSRNDKPVSKPMSKNAARKKRDKLDLKHGAVRYRVEKAGKNMEEASTMSGGAIAMSPSAPTKCDKRKKSKNAKKKTNYLKEIDMQSRDEIVQELKLKNTVKRLLNVQRIKFVNDVIEETTQQFKLRSLLKRLILEADVEKSPHSSTAINKLERLLDEIIPTLEDGYKALTTDREQRDSYRKHILSAIDNALAPAALADKIDSDNVNEVEIKIKDTDGDGKISSDPLNASDDEKFLDVRNKDKEDKEEEEDPIDSFGIEGMDKTGRDDAYRDFKQIEDKVVTTYTSMHDANDKDVFYDYLLTNVKMHFDNFEEELGNIKGEPESPSYDPDSSPADPGPGQEDMAPPDEEIEKIAAAAE